jgi:hypothetical protein
MEKAASPLANVAPDTLARFMSVVEELLPYAVRNADGERVVEASLQTPDGFVGFNYRGPEQPLEFTKVPGQTQATNNEL